MLHDWRYLFSYPLVEIQILNDKGTINGLSGMKIEDEIAPNYATPFRRTMQEITKIGNYFKSE